MKLKNKFKLGFSFGIGLALFFIITNVLNNGFQSYLVLLKTSIAAILAGTIAGFIYVWLMGLFTKSNFVKKSTTIELGADERIVFQSGANHFKGAEAVGGKLYLTNKNLTFKSHKLNIQNHQLSIPLSNISSFKKYKTFGIINNGLRIITNQGVTEKFVVEVVDEWMKKLAISTIK